jgi:hypothetical protein
VANNPELSDYIAQNTNPNELNLNTEKKSSSDSLGFGGTMSIPMLKRLAQFLV